MPPEAASRTSRAGRGACGILDPSSGGGADHQAVQFVEMVAVGKARRFGEGQIGAGAKERGQGDVQFQSGQRGANAEVQSAAKGRMRFLRAGGVEDIGVRPGSGRFAALRPICGPRR